MTRQPWGITRRGLVAAALLGGLAAGAQAQQRYTVSVSLDYTGPFANVMDSWWAGQQTVFDWWNEIANPRCAARRRHMSSTSASVVEP